MFDLLLRNIKILNYFTDPMSEVVFAHEMENNLFLLKALLRV